MPYRWNPKGSLNPAYTGGLITDKDFVGRLYLKEEKSLRQVALACGCSLRKAARWLEIHGIPARTPLEAFKIRGAKTTEKYNREKIGGRWCSKCHGPKSYKSAFCIKCRDYKGPKHPRYKGLADIMMLLRSYLQETWRPLIFERDRFTCQSCGDSRGGNLQAHHEKPLYRIVHSVLREMGLECAPVDPAERLSLVEYLSKHPQVISLENGKTLCKDCHQVHHSGKGALPGCNWKGSYHVRIPGQDSQGC